VSAAAGPAPIDTAAARPSTEPPNAAKNLLRVNTRSPLVAPPWSWSPRSHDLERVTHRPNASPWIHYSAEGIGSFVPLVSADRLGSLLPLDDPFGELGQVGTGGDEQRRLARLPPPFIWVSRAGQGVTSPRLLSRGSRAGLASVTDGAALTWSSIRSGGSAPGSRHRPCRSRRAFSAGRR
jgi:hypothetical protein